MENKKMIQSNLIKNSISAFFAAVEIHNKPNFTYRYETVSLLIMNSWELALKAFVRKFVKDKNIFEDENHTISLDKALGYTSDYINSIKPKSFNAIKKNIEEIELYRNKVTHFYSEKIEPYIFMLISKSTVNYVEFMKKYFKKDISNMDGLFILPLGFKLPFKPEDFLCKKSIDYASTKESKEFIQSIVKSIRELKDDGVDDSIVIGFDIYFESVKKLTNSDIIAAITKIEEADSTFAKITRVKLTNDPSAQVINMSDEEFRKIWKYTYHDIVDICKKEIVNFKQNSFFNSTKKEIEKDINCAYRRSLDSKNPKSATKVFYTEYAIERLKEIFNSRKK